MPYKSKAQQGKFHAMAARGEISAATVRHWDQATKKKPGGFASLPEHVKSSLALIDAYVSFLPKNASMLSVLGAVPPAAAGLAGGGIIPKPTAMEQHLGPAPSPAAPIDIVQGGPAATPTAKAAELAQAVMGLKRAALRRALMFTGFSLKSGETVEPISFTKQAIRANTPIVQSPTVQSPVMAPKLPTPPVMAPRPTLTMAGMGLTTTGLPAGGEKAPALPGVPGHAATNVIDRMGGLDHRGLTVDGNNAAGIRKGASGQFWQPSTEVAPADLDAHPTMQWFNDKFPHLFGGPSLQEQRRMKQASLGDWLLAGATKEAMVGTLAAAGLGALSAPPGRRWEGASRGVGRWTGIGAGMSLGAGTAGLIGAGLGAAIGALATGGNKYDMMQGAMTGAVAGGGIGGVGGGIYGGVKGWNTVGNYMGPASYDPRNKNPDLGLDKERRKAEAEKKKKLQKAALVDTAINAGLSLGEAALQGMGVEAARAYSQRQPLAIRGQRAGHGVSRGIAALGGTGLGAMLGGFGGGGLGLGGSRLLTEAFGQHMSPGAAAVLPFAASLALGGAGLGLGGYYGGRLGLHLTRNKDEKEKEKPRSKAATFVDGLFDKRATDIIPGGLADNKPDSAFASKSLAAGRKVESEHTSNPAIATEIAKDHLTEDKEYYAKLKKMEAKEGRAKQAIRLNMPAAGLPATMRASPGIPAFLGTPTPHLPPPPAHFEPGMMRGSGPAAFRRVANNLAQGGMSPNQANAAARPVEDFVHNYGMQPNAVYQRVLQNAVSRGASPEQAMDAARRAAAQAGPHADIVSQLLGPAAAGPRGTATRLGGGPTPLSSSPVKAPPASMPAAPPSQAGNSWLRPALGLGAAGAGAAGYEGLSQLASQRPAPPPAVPDFAAELQKHLGGVTKELPDLAGVPQ